MTSGLDVSGRRVLVLGLGVTGREVAKVLAERGARVLASDAGAVPETVRTELEARGVDVESGGHERAAASLDSFECVVPSPGISPLRGFLARVVEHGVRIVPELEIAAGMTNATVVAVTGTNGKTTVCHLLERMGREAGRDVYACGNLATTFVSATDAHPDADAFAVEASSFALAFCRTFRPRVAIVTNLAPDHLDWHGSFEHYRQSKARIAARQTADDLYLYPRSQPELARLAPDDGPRRVVFSAADCDDPGLARFRERGPHFADDAAAAVAAARFLDVDEDPISRALASFTFDPHRLEPIGAKDGVRVYDDSVSANPLATVAALRAFSDPVVLICGGRNKGGDLGVLSAEASRLRAAVVMGEAAPELAQIFEGVDVLVKAVGSMDEAVSVALRAASPGDVVLLSAACASWDMFNGYAERGRAFREACRTLGVDDA